MAAIHKYRVRCTTDNKNEYWWLHENDPEPTTCPVNTAHTIDSALTSIVETVEQTLQDTRTVLAPTPLKIAGEGFQFTAAKGVETPFDYKLLNPVRLRGGVIECLRNEFSDKITLQVIDIDDVLGLGPNTVVSQYFKDWNVPLSGVRGNDNYSTYEIIEPSIGTLIPANLYIRVKYTSSGSANDVKVQMNLRSYQDA